MPAETELRIAVVDDSETDRVRTVNMIKEILCGEAVPHKVAAFAGGVALLDAIRSGQKYNLLMLDVMMDEMGGMELAAELRRQGENASIIFLSTNREMAMYGYEQNAVRYLAKPLEQERLMEALLYCRQLWQDKKEILLPTVQGQYRISFSDIQFVEAFDRGTRFCIDGEMVECRMKMSDVEAWLPKSVFLQCHRGFIVNLSSVIAIRNYEFVMSGGSVIPISKNRYAEIHRRFVEYITN